MLCDRLRRSGIATVLLVVATATPTCAQIAEYEETCEVSAAVALDERHFAVANDETGTIAIYERDKARPVFRFELPVDVTDIEAAARIGDTVFWLTSHSLTKTGKDKAERKLLLATTITSGPGLEMAGQPYPNLRKMLQTVMSTSDATRSEPLNTNLADRLNIEGLASTPDGRLLVGLRGPRTEAGAAVVVRLDDPFALVGLPRPPVLPPPAADQPPVVKVELAGRGIRSMERVGEGERAYLIAAGSEPDGGAAPLLFWWDGASDKGTKGPELGALAETVPEALIAWSPTHVQLFGDNGDRCTDKPKFKGRRWFPSQELSIGK